MERLRAAKAKYEAAEKRFEQRQLQQAQAIKNALDVKLANFDLYVKSVLDAKAIKILGAKRADKKKRLQDEMVYTENHYKKVRETIVEYAGARATVYKVPSYLVSAKAALDQAQALVDELQGPEDREPTPSP